jgi:hypothetical protein
MLNLSEVLLQHLELESFTGLLDTIRAEARAGALYFRIDVKPPFFDTPPDWEDRLEAAFNEVNRA